MMHNQFKLLMFLLVYFFIPASSLIYEKELTDYLFETYSPLTRPVVNATSPVMVQLGFELVQIISIEERPQHITNKVWMRMSWTNELLTWDPLKWGNVTSVGVPPSNVWVPDVVLYNEVADDLSAGTGKYKTRVTMYSNGSHSWNCPLIFVSSCIIDVKDFPMDHQACHMKFGSWTFNQNELDLKLDHRPITAENYINSSEWDLKDVTKKRNYVKYKCCPNYFADITFTLHLKRKPLYYIFNVTSPCIILMIIILFSFFLPPDSGERIAVIITVLLGFAIFLQIISDYLPRNSNSTPTLSVFYITIMAESACSLIATCLVLLVHYHGSSSYTSPMYPWVKKYVLMKLSRYFCVSYKRWDQNGVEIEMKEPNNTFACQPHITTDASNQEYNYIVKEVKGITSAMNDQITQDKISEEWHILAKVLDRMFFFLFLVIFVLSTFCILLPVYLKHLEED